jgi:hypothetical protein
MATAMYIKTTVLPGGRIEVSVPELVEGQQATVFVVLEEKVQEPKRTLSEILRNYPGGQLFKTAAEVDAYIRAERDSWES